MERQNHEKFTINVNIGTGEYQPLSLVIQEKENTDGIAFYNCEYRGKTIAQLRKNNNEEWEQISGEFEPRTVKNIGKAIELHYLS